MDAGAGLLEVLDALPAPTRVRATCGRLADAPRLFGPQKGAIAGGRRRARVELRRSSVRRPAPAPARRAASARRSRRSAPSSSPARELILEVAGFDPTRLRPRRHRRGNRRRDDVGGQGPGRRRPCAVATRACAASSSEDACSRARRCPCRATRRGPMTIWSRWVSGWLGTSPPDDVEAPRSTDPGGRRRAVVLVAPDGLARPRPDPHDLERAHATLALRVVLVEEVERVLDGVDERLAGLPESQVQPRVRFRLSRTA